MSEAKEKSDSKAVMLNGLLAFKVGMSTVFNDAGEAVPVTVLKYEPWVVSEVKTKEKHGYEAVQLACGAQRATRSTKAMSSSLKKSGFEHGAKKVQEFRQDLPEGIEVGQRVEINSLKKGDVVKVTGTSRGRGFMGVVRRWAFAGGPATHGSGFHRKPGSVGCRTQPGQVLPGKKMAGHWGAETVTVKNLKIVDVIAEENVVLVAGAVPGHRHSLVKLVKV